MAELDRPGDVGKSEVSQIKIVRSTGANQAPFIIQPSELAPLRILIENIEKQTLPALMDYGKVEPKEE